MLKNLILLTLITFTLASCGGGGGGDGKDPAIATGQLKDSNVIGIAFVSGGETGITGINGDFTYEVGETITFSIGGVVIGSTLGKSIITPVDFVTNGSSSNTEVQNIVRFLMMLDDDGDTSNGINISSSIPAIAANWTQVNFAAADLAVELTSIISDAASADGGVHTLPDANTAKAHLEQTLLCVYSGAYKGTYSGDDNGNFGIVIDSSDGQIGGFAYSVPMDAYLELNGTVPISFDQNASFQSGNVTSNSDFTGQLSGNETITGTWVSTALSGNFSAARIGGSLSAIYRFTGTYTGVSDAGLLTFDIDAFNNASGVFYSAITNNIFPLTGTVSGTTLSASVSDGTIITGTLNTSSGTLSGAWNNGVFSGSISGSGCKLN